MQQGKCRVNENMDFNQPLDFESSNIRSCQVERSDQPLDFESSNIGSCHVERIK